MIKKKSKKKLAPEVKISGGEYPAEIPEEKKEETEISPRSKIGLLHIDCNREDLVMIVAKVNEIINHLNS